MSQQYAFFLDEGFQSLEASQQSQEQLALNSTEAKALSSRPNERSANSGLHPDMNHIEVPQRYFSTENDQGEMFRHERALSLTANIQAKMAERKGAVSHD